MLEEHAVADVLRAVQRSTRHPAASNRGPGAVSGRRLARTRSRTRCWVATLRGSTSGRAGQSSITESPAIASVGRLPLLTNAYASASCASRSTSTSGATARVHRASVSISVTRPSRACATTPRPPIRIWTTSGDMISPPDSLREFLSRQFDRRVIGQRQPCRRASGLTTPSNGGVDRRRQRVRGWSPPVCASNTLAVAAHAEWRLDHPYRSRKVCARRVWLVELQRPLDPPVLEARGDRWEELRQQVGLAHGYDNASVRMHPPPFPGPRIVVGQAVDDLANDLVEGPKRVSKRRGRAHAHGDRRLVPLVTLLLPAGQDLVVNSNRHGVMS